MNVSLKYGQATVELELPAGKFSTLLPKSSHRGTRASILEDGQCFDSAVQGVSLREFLTGKQQILVVVSDATRRTGSREIVSNLTEYFSKYDIKYEELNIIISTGIHRPPTDEEVSTLLGDQRPPNSRLISYRADDREALVYVGRTSAGNEVHLHHSLIRADAVIVCGGVGFHYFAGFSGGRKSIMPGLAAVESLSFNHNLIFSGSQDGRHPAARTASLDGNPVHEDMMEAMAMIGHEKLFMINTLFSPQGEMTDVICGHPVHSHREACRRYLEEHSVVIPRLADVVVASAGGFPRDINMIQSHKAIEMARYALKPGGVLVVLAACREGMGHPALFPWFRFESESEFLRELRANYVVNGQTALAIFEKSRRYRIYFASELNPADVRRMGMIPLEPTRAAIQKVLDEEAIPRGGYIIPEAVTTFCQLSGEQIRPG
jgi:nickel-dependent lactate racemase